ncbi:MAG TPA: competence/damage-inducible protein A [Gemmatimonadaceae bacterium]
MDIEVVTIGSELLLGFTIDTNAAHLARELAALGVSISRRTTVPDDAGAIAGAVGAALDRSGAVITTGGLGPTADDFTKDAIAALFGLEMVLDERILEGLKRLWRERGRPGELPVANHQQARIPRGARVLRNNHGSAPGIWLEDPRGRWVAMLPGVPSEMRGMLADTLLPLVRERVAADGAPATVVRSRTLRTTGIAESVVAERLGDAAREAAGLPVAYLPGLRGLDLRLTASGLPPEAADAALERGIDLLRERVGRYIYGEGDADLAAVVLERCRSRGLRIALAESCTGGLLGARLTAVPGSSDVVLGAVVAYANEVKETQLDVPRALLAGHGAVSEPVARAMASGVRRRFGAEIGIAVTGIAGPAGGTPEKPVGTVWIAIDAAQASRAVHARFFGDREEIRERAAQSALDLARRMLEEGGD